MPTSWWDIVFPPTCVGCKRAGEWVCDPCKKTIRFFTHERCRHCGGKRTEDHVCKKTWTFDSCVSIGSYGDPVWQQILKRFKYNSGRCLEEDLGKILVSFRETYLDPWPWAGLERLTICPVPTDAKRIRGRGFDHAIAFANHLQMQFVPWAELESLLIRTKASPPNAKLDEDVLRQANVQGLFKATRKIDTPVLLIDDVLTSGATLCEAEKVLREAGATQVHVFVFAKAAEKRDVGP